MACCYGGLSRYFEKAKEEWLKGGRLKEAAPTQALPLANPGKATCYQGLLSFWKAKEKANQTASFKQEGSFKEEAPTKALPLATQGKAACYEGLLRFWKGKKEEASFKQKKVVAFQSDEVPEDYKALQDSLLPKKTQYEEDTKTILWILGEGYEGHRLREREKEEAEERTRAKKEGKSRRKETRKRRMKIRTKALQKAYKGVLPALLYKHLLLEQDALKGGGEEEEDEAEDDEEKAEDEEEEAEDEKEEEAEAQAADWLADELERMPQEEPATPGKPTEAIVQETPGGSRTPGSATPGGTRKYKQPRLFLT